MGKAAQRGLHLHVRYELEFYLGRHPGIEDELTPPEPVQDDPGRWSDEDRERHGIQHLPSSLGEQAAALDASPRVREALGDALLGSFLATRRSDAAWAADRPLDETIAAHRWRY
ncbi:glutamine synthetase [Egibacter rhizosphaerae]|uniref:glutamine synthetase n=1 Tax=Egibacter rhizosphaerae TaxID=1670831 RepID=UPI0013F15767|nr:glutamine synthetase [Egibacter rhizosphaerae]